MIARQPIIPEYFEVHLTCIFAVGLGGLVYVLGGVDAACATLKATLVCVSDAGQESKKAKPKKAKPESSKPTAGQASEPESSQSKAGKDDCVSSDSLRHRPAVPWQAAYPSDYAAAGATGAVPRTSPVPPPPSSRPALSRSVSQ